MEKRPYSDLYSPLDEAKEHISRLFDIVQKLKERIEKLEEGESNE